MTRPIAPRLDQRADDGLRADAAIVRVGAVEDLVEQEQHRPRAARRLDDGADAENLRVEARVARLQRVLDVSVAPSASGDSAQRVGPDRRARQRQHRR